MPAQPQNTPTVSKPTPVVLDELLIETTDSNKALYDRQLEFGHLYPDQLRYPGFRFLAAKPTQYGQMQYLWGNGFTAQDGYNAAKDYSGDANAYPIFARSYRVLRSDYLVTGPSPKGLPFTGVAAISVTAGGTGYAADFAVTFTGGAGSGASATAIVSNSSVVRIEITSVGTGYTSAPTLSFSGGGTGASATAVIQPATALLVSEKHSKLPEDDPYTSLYDLVTLVYETLPGPWLPFTRWDIWLGAIQGQRRAVLAAPGQDATLSATGKTTYAAREGSAIVSVEIQEFNTNGSGDPDNPEFPEFDQRIYEDERGQVETVSQLVVATGSEVPTINESVGTYTHIDYQTYPDNQFLLKKVTETFHLATPSLPDVKNNEDGTVTTITRLIKLASAITEGESIPGGIWTKISSRAINALISWEITETRVLPGNVLEGHKISDAAQGQVVTTERQLLDSATAVFSPSYLDLVYEDKPVGEFAVERYIESASSFPILYDYYRDPLKNNALVTISYQIVAASTSLPADSVGSGVYVHHEIRHIDKFRSMLITSTYSIPVPFTEYRFGAFTMPGLLDILVYEYTDACGAFIYSDLSVYPAYAYRPSDSMMTQMFTEYEWFDSMPTPTDCFFFVHSSQQLGKFWQGWNRVLMDAYMLPTTCGGSSFTVDLAASAPVDWSTYCSAIVGNPQLVAEEIVQEGLLFKRTRLNVVMR